MRDPIPWPVGEPRTPNLREQIVTLAAEDRAGMMFWATNIGDKRALLAGTEGTLWAFWKGRRQTHLFEVDRRLAAEEVGEGKRETKREIPPAQRRLIVWHSQEAQQHGFVTIHPRFDADSVRAAGQILGWTPDHGTIKAMIQWGFRDREFRSRLFTLKACAAQWDRLRLAWDDAGHPPYEPWEE
jgi:hypothetical protein